MKSSAISVLFVFCLLLLASVSQRAWADATENASGDSNCFNSDDDDEDGFTDCEDPDCASVRVSNGDPTDLNEEGEETADYCADGEYFNDTGECGNNTDDGDADSLADCLDPDCDGSVTLGGGFCEFGTEAACDDGSDNDGDGAPDGYDEDCAEGDGGYGCSDGTDNDNDGFSDCADISCDGASTEGVGYCEFGAEVTCDDGSDNDGDSAIDGEDADCANEGAGGFGCDNVEDDDLDGLADCAEPACDGLSGASGELCEPSGEATCDDGYDNDGDEEVDQQDADCDNAAPAISGVSSETTETTATITWETDEASGSYVEYGLTLSYGGASSSALLVTSHTVTLQSLQPGTTYQFRVASADASENTATSSNDAFTTSAVPSAADENDDTRHRSSSGRRGGGSMARETIVTDPGQPSENAEDGTSHPRRDLELGSEGTDVRLLQRFLNYSGYAVAAEGPGSTGRETTYFGRLTQAALSRFQSAKQITPAHGYFGPRTRAWLEANMPGAAFWE